MLKVVMILAIIVITGPTATHALARAALHNGLTPELDEDEIPSSS